MKVLLIVYVLGKPDFIALAELDYDGARQRGDGVAALAPQRGATAQGESERVPFWRE